MVKTRLLLFTSGGDAAGMCAAVRAVVRVALEHECDVFVAYDGYQGICENNIQPFTWQQVGGIMDRGGTVIGTARCAAFRTREGREQAARNLLERGINALVCIGGDGSLSGADIFRREWPDYVEKWASVGAISAERASECAELRVVGFVGTIDNDVCGTHMTIGTDSALERIVYAVDCLQSTADSHSRVAVVEAMGRHCGYLAVVAALVTGADYCLAPEMPVPATYEGGWRKHMCDAVRGYRRRTHTRSSIVIVCEGAVDAAGEPITSAEVREVIEKTLGYETRVTVLGHIQRGGPPSVQDTLIATLMGERAVQCAVADDYTEPVMVGIEGARIVVNPLMQCVEQSRLANEHLRNGRFQECLELRCPAMVECVDVLCRFYDYNAAFSESVQQPSPPQPMTSLSSSSSSSSPALPDALQRRASVSSPFNKQARKGNLRIGICCIGAPSPGMSMAIGIVARLALEDGHTVIGVRDGCLGLIGGHCDELTLQALHEQLSHGGTMLGCARAKASQENMAEVAAGVERMRLDALVMIGGFEGYCSLSAMAKARPRHPQLDIPLIAIPATISGNLPGTECTIGCDRGIANLVDAIVKIKESAVSMRRAFLVQTMGRQCGMLALLGALLSGAECAMLPEDAPHTLGFVHSVMNMCKARFERTEEEIGGRASRKTFIMVKNEAAGANIFTMDFLQALLASESDGQYDVRTSNLGHLQQGGKPTVTDRFRAARFGIAALRFLFQALHSDMASFTSKPAVCAGEVDGRIVFTDLHRFDDLVDKSLRRPKEQWWLRLRPLADLLAQPYAGYTKAVEERDACAAACDHGAVLK